MKKYRIKSLNLTARENGLLTYFIIKFLVGLTSFGLSIFIIAVYSIKNAYLFAFPMLIFSVFLFYDFVISILSIGFDVARRIYNNNTTKR